MAERHVIERSTGAELALERDELCLDARIDAPRDVPKYRGSSPYPDGWLIAFSGDYRPNGSTRYEKVLFGIRHDDDFPKEVQAYEFAILGQDPGGTEDATMRTWFRATSQYVEVHGQRVSNSGGLNQFFSHDAASGRTLMFNPQADKAWPVGGIIVYDVTGGQLKAIGKIEVKPL